MSPRRYSLVMKVTRTTRCNKISVNASKAFELLTIQAASYLGSHLGSPTTVTTLAVPAPPRQLLTSVLTEPFVRKLVKRYSVLVLLQKT